MEEDTESDLNLEELNDSNSEQNAIKRNNDNDSDKMKEAGKKNSEMLGNGDLTQEEENMIVYGDPADNDESESIDEITTEGNNAIVPTDTRNKIEDTKKNLADATQKEDLQYVTQLVHVLSSLTASIPAIYRNEVMNDTAGIMRDMTVDGERVFKNDNQLMNFIKGLFTGQAMSKPKNVERLMKRSKLTQHLNINPVLRKKVAKPLTRVGNYVYYGNSNKIIC